MDTQQGEISATSRHSRTKCSPTCSPTTSGPICCSASSASPNPFSNTNASNEFVHVQHTYLCSSNLSDPSSRRYTRTTSTFSDACHCSSGTGCRGCISYTRTITRSPSNTSSDYFNTPASFTRPNAAGFSNATTPVQSKSTTIPTPCCDTTSSKPYTSSAEPTVLDSPSTTIRCTWRISHQLSTTKRSFPATTSRCEPSPSSSSSTAL